MTTDYILLKKGLYDKGTLIPKDDDLYAHIDPNQDYYRSVFLYNQSHFETFKTTRSVKGIEDVDTNYIVFDFDSDRNPELARTDTIELASRLLGHGLNPDDFNIYWSGSKGFSVELYATERFTPAQFKSITGHLSEGLKTRDTVVVNASRLFRIPFTKNPKSGLYKFPVTLNQLSELTVDSIKELSKSLDNAHQVTETQVILPDSITSLANTTKQYSAGTLDEAVEDIDFSKKPKNLPVCKYMLMNGYIKPGSKHHSIMALSAHYKSIGYPLEVTYGLVKASLRLARLRYPGDDAVAKEDVYKRVEEVYSPTWQGKTYSCREHDFLRVLCSSVPGSKCSSDLQSSLVTIDSVADGFTKYAKDIDKNTVKTGISSIDKQIRLQTCSHVVLAACSGAGKTSTILNFLNNHSLNNLKGIFYSLDMNSQLVYQKLAHRVTGLDDKKLYDIYKNNEAKKIEDIKSKINADFKNILFDFRSGVTIDELRENLLEAKMKLGDDLKLGVVDFINRIRGPYSDETSNLAYIAPRLSDLANETEMLLISLAQTARSQGGPAQPLMSSRVSKGSSAIEESATVLLGIWRPFYLKGENDKYMCISALKTRMGKEFTEALHFDGLTSRIRDLSQDEQKRYEQLLDEQAMKDGEDKYSDL